MYFLAGLMGLMALGSVAMVGIGEADEEPLPEEGDDWDDTGFVPLPDPGRDVPDGGRLLFDRMGLINLPGMGRVADDEDDGPLGEDEMMDETEMKVLRLHGYRIGPGFGEAGEMPADEVAPGESHSGPVDLMEYDAEQDQLLIIFDDSAEGQEPALELTVSKDDPETTEIRLGDKVLGILATDSAPPLSAFVLVGESDASALGLSG